MLTLARKAILKRAKCKGDEPLLSNFFCQTFRIDVMCLPLSVLPFVARDLSPLKHVLAPRRVQASQSAFLEERERLESYLPSHLTPPPRLCGSPGAVTLSHGGLASCFLWGYYRPCPRELHLRTPLPPRRRSSQDFSFAPLIAGSIRILGEARCCPGSICFSSQDQNCTPRLLGYAAIA